MSSNACTEHTCSDIFTSDLPAWELRDETQTPEGNRGAEIRTQKILTVPEVYRQCKQCNKGSQMQIRTKTPTYQRSTAEQDHEYDEGFKPVVLHDDEAGFPECPPALILCSLFVDLAALEPAHAAWGNEGKVGQRHRKWLQDLTYRPCWLKVIVWLNQHDPFHLLCFIIYSHFLVEMLTKGKYSSSHLHSSIFMFFPCIQHSWKTVCGGIWRCIRLNVRLHYKLRQSRWLLFFLSCWAFTFTVTQPRV